MSQLDTDLDITAVSQENAALAARLVERCCGPAAPTVLAMLVLDAASTPAPARQPGQRAASASNLQPRGEL